jgi:hypothetical protein
MNVSATTTHDVGEVLFNEIKIFPTPGVEPGPKPGILAVRPRGIIDIIVELLNF